MFFEIGCDQMLFEGLTISQEKELCETHMGQYPVIFISLKSVDGTAFEDAVAALRRVIGREARRFDFLLESDQLSQGDRDTYQALTQTKNGIFTMAEEALIDSLRTLSELLSKHYRHKVILLTDEYDVQLDKALQAGYYDEMVSLIRNLFGNVLKQILHFILLYLQDVFVFQKKVFLRD